MEDRADIQRLYQQALDSLIEKVRQDPYILAAVLLGSLSYDVVWEKSDIDLLLITQEVKQKIDSFALVEHGVNIHAILVTRSEFRKTMEGAIQSSFMHSLLSKGRLLYTQDESIEALLENRNRLGARDREIQLLRAGSFVLPGLVKAEKWFYVKKDLDYTFFWIMQCVNGLASIEVIQQGEITSREVVQQALRHNPAFFKTIYSDLINGPKTEAALAAALDVINAYLTDRIPILFKPVLEYLSEAGGVRSASDLNHYFSNQMNLSGIDGVCEWLADEDVIQKVSSPRRLTDKSRVDVEEAAYYYEE